MQFPHTFIVLDLETTGLSPDRDTIIEIAAVRFSLVRDEAGYRVEKEESRSMLIDPLREIVSEVTSITGISQEMLRGKESWDAVRDRVADFLGRDSVLIGHNVAFDISMIESHGIDCSTYPVIDTFELSEIFSQEAKSLNLQFLIEHYGLGGGGEHRALHDVRMTRDLFLLYLDRLSQMGQEYQQYWDRLALLDSSGGLKILAQITQSLHSNISPKEAIRNNISSLSLFSSYSQLLMSGGEGTRSPHPSPLLEGEGTRQGDKNIIVRFGLPSPSRRGVGGEVKFWAGGEVESSEDLTGSQGDKNIPSLQLIDLAQTTGEIGVLSRLLDRYPQILLLVRGYHQRESLREQLISHGFSVSFSHPLSDFISLDRLRAYLDSPRGDRKYAILILKLLAWLDSTKTGLLSELRYYNAEHTMIDEFRLSSGETHHYLSESRSRETRAQIVIQDPYDFFADPTIISHRPVVVRDIIALDESSRAFRTRILDFSLIEGYLSRLTLMTGDPSTRTQIARLTDQITFLDSLLSRIPDRPTGTAPYPPGSYGETYHLSQEEIWQSGGWVLLSLGRVISSLWSEIRGVFLTIDDASYLLDQCDGCCSTIRDLIQYRLRETSCILSIREGITRLHLIPRSQRAEIEHTLLQTQTPLVIGYGYGISGVVMQGYREQEILREAIFSHSDEREGEGEDISQKQDSSTNDSYLHILRGRSEIGILLHHIRRSSARSFLILTTNLKQIKEIGQSLKQQYPGENITYIIQGLSGGKEKMISNFLKASGIRILVGLIDTWSDESRLWSEVDEIFLIKVPFDPPTDVRFLARTVGMRNNFEQYSLPHMLIKINTLLGRIRESGYTPRIAALDTRLVDTQWGQKIQSEIIYNICGEDSKKN